jgi:hypothetical protein
MTSFVQPNFPTHHEGVERMSDGIDSATAAYRKFDSARGLATFLLVVVVSGLIFAANQWIDTWADGHLLAAWVLMWFITFTVIALAVDPIRRAINNVKALDGSAAYAAWSTRRKARMNDEKMWDYARQDPRLMADIVRAVERAPDAAKNHLRA